eukprot:5291339-Amphidinium_carterae.1
MQLAQEKRASKLNTQASSASPAANDALGFTPLHNACGVKEGDQREGWQRHNSKEHRVFGDPRQNRIDNESIAISYRASTTPGRNWCSIGEGLALWEPCAKKQTRHCARLADSQGRAQCSESPGKGVSNDVKTLRLLNIFRHDTGQCNDM